jgi:PAS domain S-box-containing protein
MLDGLISIDANGNIESFNASCERIFGYKAEEVIGRNIKILMPEPYHHEHDGYISNYIKTGNAKIIGTSGREVKAQRKDGTVFPIDLSISTFMLEGKPYFSGIIRDITQRKKTEEERGLLVSIIESSEDAIISRDPDGIIISWNAAAERLFGYTAEEAIGQHVRLIIPQERQAEETHIVSQIQEGKKVEHFETQRRRKDGKYIDIALTVSPIRDTEGKVVGASKIAHDITERKNTEAQLMRYMKELERSNQELDDFAYIASHDLKEPLRGLFNHAAFLLEDYSDRLDEEGKRRLQRLSDLSSRMEHLVNDLLYFSRLGRSKLAVQETDMNIVIQDIQQMMESFLKENKGTISIPQLLPTVVCDKPRITEVFRNLITNAVKYNDKGDRIVEVGFLENTTAPHGPEKNVFYVKDIGIGIERDFYQEIFRIFKRLQKDGKNNAGGTGVGLTFVKKIIERHNGRIWLESEPGRGTTFYFTIGKAS